MNTLRNLVARSVCRSFYGRSKSLLSCHKVFQCHHDYLAIPHGSTGYTKTLTCSMPGISTKFCHTKVNEPTEKSRNTEKTSSSLPSSDLGKVVYTGPNNSTVKLVKYFSLSSSAIGILFQPYLINQMANNGAAVKMSIIMFTGVFVIGTPFLLHFMSKRYVTEMYYNKDTKTFTAMRFNFFARRKSLSFHPQQISDSIPSPLSNFCVGSEAFLIDTDLFRDTSPDAYAAFMRYDEPLDLTKYFSEQKPDDSNK